MALALALAATASISAAAPEKKEEQLDPKTQKEVAVLVQDVMAAKEAGIPEEVIGQAVSDRLDKIAADHTSVRNSERVLFFVMGGVVALGGFFLIRFVWNWWTKRGAAAQVVPPPPPPPGGAPVLTPPTGGAPVLTPPATLPATLPVTLPATLPATLPTPGLVG